MAPTPPRTRKPSVTVKEVAELAGVSQMTVSRVLNQPDLVREDTSRRVREAIKKLNYRPNLMAKSLAGGGSLLIGLMYHNPSMNYLGEVMVGALNACRKRGHHLLVDDFFSDVARSNAAQIKTAIEESAVNALIICPPLGELPEICAALQATEIPFVRITNGIDQPADQYVTIDDAGAVAAMTKYLIQLGHRRIGFISGPEGHASSTPRVLGFRRALAAAGITIDEALIVRGEYNYRSGMTAATKLLDLADRPSAIFASNDDMAAGAIAAAFHRGLDVPGDVSIAGFDDTAMATSIWPMITTVRQPISDMAFRAVELLDRMRKGEPSPSGVVLNFEIVPRGSTAKR